MPVYEWWQEKYDEVVHDNRRLRSALRDALAALDSLPPGETVRIEPTGHRRLVNHLREALSDTPLPPS